MTHILKLCESLYIPTDKTLPKALLPKTGKPVPMPSCAQLQDQAQAVQIPQGGLLLVSTPSRHDSHTPSLQQLRLKILARMKGFEHHYTSYALS